MQAFLFRHATLPYPPRLEGGALLVVPLSLSSSDIAPPSYQFECLEKAGQGHRVGTGYEQGTGAHNPERATSFHALALIIAFSRTSLFLERFWSKF